jgi:CheY-like chemotaxis protein
MSLGVINEQLGEFELAAQAYRRALVLEPQDRAAWYYAHNNLGFCLNQMHDFREAESYLRQAIEIEPAWHNAYKNLGVALAAQGDYAEAANQFVLATVLAPYDPRALDRLEGLLDEHDLVYLQVPEIRSDLEKCRKLVKRKDHGPDGVQRISPPTTAAMTESCSEEAQQKPKTIAILDDEVAMLEILVDQLANEGFEVLSCTNKRTFLKELPKLTVDLVISDINSPEMNGMQFLTEMRRYEKGRNIPVIIVSGMGGAEAVKAKLQGAYEVFAKPCAIEELLDSVRRALAKG